MTAANATLAANEPEEANGAAAVGAPLPWQMIRVDYEAARSDLFSAGDAAEAAHPIDFAAFQTLALSAEVLDANIAALRTRFWDAGAGIRAAPIGKKLEAAEIERDAIRGKLKAQNLAFGARWNSRQEAYVSHAQAHLRTWIDEGVVQLHPYEPGSPLLTMSSHEDVVRVAIAAGHPVPDIVLEDYPRLKAKMAAHLFPERLKALLGFSDEYWNRTTERDRQQYALVRPLPDAAYAVDVAIARIDDFLKGQEADLRSAGGSLEINPDYQRGHVWSDYQRSRYIESVMRGQAPTRLLFNCPGYVGGSLMGEGDIPPNVMQCIDGLQRMTALTGWARGEVTAFGGQTISDFEGGPFDASRYRIQFVVYQFEFRRDLLQFYLDLNGAGVVHAPEELDRVRALRDATAAAGRIAPTEPSAEGRRPQQRG